MQLIEILILFSTFVSIFPILIRHNIIIPIISFFVIFHWEIGVSVPILTLGRFNIHIEDILMIPMILYTLIKWNLKSTHPPKTKSIWKSFVLLILLSVARGVENFGITAAVNEARPFVYFVIASFWLFSNHEIASSISILQFQKMQAFFLKIAYFQSFGLVLMASYHFFRFGLQNVSVVFIAQSGDNAQVGRILTSGQAMCLFFCFLLINELEVIKLIRKNIWLSSIIVVLIFSLQRTVWISIIAAIIWLTLTRRAPVRTQSALLIVILFSIVFFLIIQFSQSKISQILIGASTNSKTGFARLIGWQYLFEQFQMSGISNILFGAPFGSGYLRVENSQIIGYSPHNFYVNIMLRAGIIGLAFFIFVILSFTRFIQKSRNQSAISIAISLLVYMLSYNLNWYFMPFIGWAFLTASQWQSDNFSRRIRGE